jgi:hypothetical protein
LIAGVIIVAACGGKKEKPKPDATVACQMQLSGAIAVDTTVPKGCTATVSEDVTVATGTLTVEAGAKVAFIDGRSLTIGASGPAKLVVKGTAAEPAVFTLAGENLPGGWGQVRLAEGAAGSTIAGLALDKAGKDGKSALLVEAEDVSITASSIKAVAGVGIELAPGFRFAAFADNKVEGTGLELLKLGPAGVGSIGERNVFAETGAIAVVPGGLTRSITWRDHGVPYVVKDILKIERAGTRATLTLAAGVDVRFTAKAGFAVGVGNPGGLRVAGEAPMPVSLGSSDGKPAGWTLWVGSKGEAVIEHAVIAQGGLDGDTGAIAVRKGSLEVYDTSFEDDVVGVSADAEATIAIDRCTFTKNSLYAVALHSQLGGLGDNTFDDGTKIELRGGTVQGATRWDPGVMVWWAGRIVVDEGTLTIAPGSEFTMMSNKAKLEVASRAAGKKGKKASLVIQGTAEAPVKLAGVRSSPGTWGNIVLTGEQDSVLEHVALSGSGGDAAIAVGDGARVRLGQVSCEQCAGAVLTRTCGAQVTLEGVTIGAGTPKDVIEPACTLVSVPAPAPAK